MLLLLCGAIAASGQSIAYTKVDREIIEERLGQYEGDNEARRVTLRGLFEKAGCKDGNLTDQEVKGETSGNIICTIPGEGDSVIVVGAHFDKKGSGTGVVDNWSGAALLPSLYQSLIKSKRRHTFVIVGFAEKEKGRNGSKAFVNQMTKEEAGKTVAMVNIDSLGLSPSKVKTNDDNGELTSFLAGVAKAVKVPVLAQNIENLGADDAEAFSNRKIPCVTVHSLTPENVNVLHSKKDTIEAVQKDDYYNSYLLLAAYLAYLDIKL